MQPDVVATKADDTRSAFVGSIPASWRGPLGLLAFCTALLSLVTMREWGEMFHQWWNIDTYTHILLVPPIIGWLVWLRVDELRKLVPAPWLPGLGLVAAALGLWVIGRSTGINLFAHAGAVGALQAAVVAILGVRAALLLALPIGFATFLVPFGDEIIPALQFVTAKIAVALTHWSGIPALVDGIYIETPVGLFIVAEACSGVKFLVAMVTLAVLVCFTRFESWTHRAAFMAASIVVPIIANGARAWGTIYIAQFQGVEFAAGFDHIFYGWIFFALVVAILIAGASKFFERAPDEHGLSAEHIRSWRWVEKAERSSASLSATGGAIAAMAFAAAMLAAIVAPSSIG
ncbi:exosortase A [Erythrobacter sp. THAF29]|uniref:exosortase A n=1 Tax=Erythrobacter sp. THAF29 TaxID=2587851 RepID=UPI001268DCC5|nr:exosortase A [Erythrobacter sp. THAF29]QFT78023.1 Transmembrane exosortase [Erythrobacter sp. THAF29]